MPLSEGTRGAAAPEAAGAELLALGAWAGPHQVTLGYHTPNTACLWLEYKGAVQLTPSEGLGKCLFILLSASVHSGSKLFITFQMLFED